MKTLKEEVMELLMKRIGVVEDEEFKASTVEGACATYKISKGKLLFKNLSEEWSKTERWVNFIKDFKEYEFKVKSFRPKIGDKYWLVEVDGKVCSDISERGCTFDCMAMAIGNCFRTKESAEAHKREILEMLGVKMVQENSLGEKR